MDQALTAYLRRQPFRFVAAWRHCITGMGRSHQHNAFELVYHRRGWGKTLFANRQQREFVQGSVEINPPLLRHRQQSAADNEDICILLSARANPPAALRHPFYLPRLAPANLESQFLALAALSPAPTDPYRAPLADALATSLLLQILQATASLPPATPTNPRRQLALQARHYIDTHWNTLTNLQTLATHLNLSPDYLRHLFRAEFGVSLKQYHLSIRTNRTIDLIRHSHLPLKAIASLCGFRSICYFTTFFRQNIGLPPSAYRSSTRPPPRP